MPIMWTIKPGRTASSLVRVREKIKPGRINMISEFVEMWKLTKFPVNHQFFRYSYQVDKQLSDTFIHFLWLIPSDYLACSPSILSLFGPVNSSLMLTFWRSLRTVVALGPDNLSPKLPIHKAGIPSPSYAHKQPSVGAKNHSGLMIFSDDQARLQMYNPRPIKKLLRTIVYSQARLSFKN